jgi:hypothetical protein
MVGHEPANGLVPVPLGLGGGGRIEQLPQPLSFFRREVLVQRAND